MSSRLVWAIEYLRPVLPSDRERQAHSCPACCCSRAECRALANSNTLKDEEGSFPMCQHLAHSCPSLL